jgi:hypothetical protein
MRKTFFCALLFACTLGAAPGLLPESKAQSRNDNQNENKKTTIQVRVVEKKDGKTEVIERNYEVDALSDADQKDFVDKVLDSLGVDGKGQKQISIIVDGDDSDRTVRDRRRIEIRERPDWDRSREPSVWSWGDNGREFHFDSGELQENMRRLEREMKPRVEVFRRDMERMGDRMGTIWSNDIMQAGSVRGLNAYANNPDNGVLNLRFSVPEKGDVTVTVTDTEGREVGKKVIKDFSGEFVGQVDLKKNAKGTLFVTVVQNDDGAVRRVVIK